MNTFNKKSLCVALATAGALGAGAAQAVSVNPDGLGQVLIYPYYTTQSVLNSPWNSLLSVVNTTASTKAVKIRFREGKASAEVLDFNIFLSPQDVWTGAIVPEGAGAKIISSDKSCTIPTLPAGGVPFRDLAYKDDVIGGGLERTKEGYVEIIEMATYPDDSEVAINAKHSSGVPKDCTKVTNTTAAVDDLAPQGGLSGGITLVNVLGGLDVTVDAIALANFTDQANGYRDTGSLSPSLADASPPESLSTDSQGNTVFAEWTFGEDAVSAALMKSSLLNEFVLDTATLSTTSLVVTFPTKHLYVSEDIAFLPFANPLTEDGACDPVAATDYNREEAKRTVGGPDFSPSPKAQGTSICWEANVIAVGGADAFGSANKYTIGTVFENGWIDVSFGTAAGVTPAFIPRLYADAATVFQGGSANSGSTTFQGLPVVGFAMQTFTNGFLTDPSGSLVQSTYGGSFVHKYRAAQSNPPAP